MKKDDLIELLRYRLDLVRDKYAALLEKMNAGGDVGVQAQARAWRALVVGLPEEALDGPVGKRPSGNLLHYIKSLQEEFEDTKKLAERYKKGYGLFEEIMDERRRQDRKWSVLHDDKHTLGEWVALVHDYAARATHPTDPGKPLLPHFRHKMIQVAALAVAAIETVDRASPQAKKVML